MGLHRRALALAAEGAGLGGMAAFFLLPNMLIFGIFVLLPFVINFAYSMTGGTALFLDDRTFVGADQYARLFDCGNYLDPNSCAEDTFWTAVGNTAWFVVLQVTLMILVSLITALILNRDLGARSFWRAVFFFPVLLSPVVVGLIWKWILQRQGLLNFGLYGLGLEPSRLAHRPQLGLRRRGRRLDLGAYGLLHPDPARRPAGDPEGSLRGRRDGRHPAGARLLAHHPAAARRPTCSSSSCWR